MVRVVWSVSRAALSRVRPEIRPGAGVIDVSLQIRLGDDASGESVLRADGVELLRERHAPGSARLTRDPERGLEHLDIAGVVLCTRRGDEVIFARAPVLGRLGIEGGRYEPSPTKDAER